MANAWNIGGLNVDRLQVLGHPAARLTVSNTLISGDADNAVGGLKRMRLPMRRIDRKAGSTAQNHYRKGRTGPVRNDQKVRAGIAAANRHYVLVYISPTVPVQIWRALQR
jgi:hypothetical protein